MAEIQCTLITAQATLQEAISGKACADITELLQRQRHTIDVSVGNDLKPQRSINESLYSVEERPRVNA